MPAPAEPVAVGEPGRRDHLDGLRAVAVYLVVLFHAGSLRFSGGFIGVDVFFVLSGYLVTQVLLRDLGGRGSIRFGRFYSRRVRRLLPASVIALTITALVYGGVASPIDVIEARPAFRAAFLYVANWYFIVESTGYFASNTARNPVLHMWSLAVEEQFYLLWPLLLGGLVWVTGRLRRHQRWALRATVAAGALASVVWALALRTSNPDRAYFGTDTRAYQLLAGALIALTPGLVVRAGRLRPLVRIAVPVGLLAVVGLAIGPKGMDPIVRGVAVTVVTVVLLIALDADVTGLTKRALSTRPMVYLGRVSYGTYLWHWPLIVIITLLRPVGPKPLAAIVALLATGLASLSYHLVEMPIRRSPALDRRSWPVVAVGLSVSVVAALLILPRLTESEPRPATVASSVLDQPDKWTKVPADIDLQRAYDEKFGQTVSCVGKPASDCTVVHGKGRHVLLMGDSNAQMWIPAFTQLAKDEDLTLSLAVGPGCLWQRDAFKANEAVDAICRRLKDDAYDRVIPELDPDLIVLVNSREPFGQPRATPGDDELSRTLQRSTPESLQALAKPGRDIAIIESAPTPTDDTFNPLKCLTATDLVEACRFVTSQVLDWHTELERDLAAKDDHLWTFDLDRGICPFLPICDPIVGDQVVFWNGSHITEGYSRTLAPGLALAFRSQGLLPPA